MSRIIYTSFRQIIYNKPAYNWPEGINTQIIMQINIWPTTNRKEYTRACDCKRRSQQTLTIGRSWPNRNQLYDQKIVRSGVTGA